MAIGSDIVAKAMKHEGVTDFFYIMGATHAGGGEGVHNAWASGHRCAP
jgi:hypothetical protein